MKSNKDWINIRETISLDTQTETDKRMAAYREALKADYYISSISAVTRSGELLTGDGTGTRTSGIAYSSPHVILVVGTQKVRNVFHLRSLTDAPRSSTPMNRPLTASTSSACQQRALASGIALSAALWSSLLCLGLSTRSLRA